MKGVEIKVSYEGDTPKMEVGLKMNNGDYMEWLTDNAALALYRSGGDGQEITIQMAVYNLHREILGNRGVSEHQLKEMDNTLVSKLKQHTKRHLT